MLPPSVLFHEISRKIREKRKALDQDTTQGDLAKKIGVSRATINNIETDKHRPSLVLIFRIADALGCSYLDLLPSGPELQVALNASAREKESQFKEQILSQKEAA